MRSVGFGRAWFHAYLVLGDRILALRQRGGESGSNLPTALGGDGVSLGAEPPAWKAGGCKGKRGDRCAWLRCKYEGYKTRLEHEKYQSNVEVVKKAESKMRGMSEEQRQRHLEKKFLKRFKTGRHMHKAVEYVFEGEATKCTWAKNAPTQFEAWLKRVLPARHACVKKAVDLHRPTEQICSEVFTNQFKRTLRKACQEDLEPRDEEAGGVEAQNFGDQVKSFWVKFKNTVREPYEVADIAAETAAGSGLFGTVASVALGAFTVSTVGPSAFVLAIAMFAIAVPSLAYVICNNWSKFPQLKKIAKRINRSRSPETEEQKSPEADGQKSPEADGQKSPQAKDQKSPKAEDQESLKAEEQKSPEAEDQTSPKAEDQKSPKADDQTSPEAEDQTSPEAEDQTSPEAEDQTSPEAEDQKSPEAENQKLPKAEDQKSPEAEGQK